MSNGSPARRGDSNTHRGPVAYSDSEYIEGVHRGDEGIFTELVSAYVDPLTRFAFGYLGEEDTAHDVVQDVFMRVWQLGPDWNPTTGVSPYLFAAIRHRAYDILRADHARERMRVAARRIQPAGADTGDPYADPVLVALVRKAMLQLTDRQREVLRLRYEQGHTVVEAATILGIDVRAVEKLIARGLIALRTRLGVFGGTADRG